MTDTPRLLFCVGAQKAGTTWLYKHLEHYPEVHFHRAKELQFFNNIRPARNQPGLDYDPEVLAARIKGKIDTSRENYAAHPKRRWLPNRIEILQEIESFLKKDASFLEIVSRFATDETELIADMTPEYSLLEAETFSEMLNAAPDVRFAFLMRDPVERAWSQLRFHARVSGSTPDAVLARVLKRPDSAFSLQFWSRSRYDLTYQALTEAVPADRIFTAFYESFFNEATVRAFLEFAGLRYIEPSLDEVVFGSKTKPLDADFEQVALEKLQPCYTYIHDTFGSQVPPSWRKPLT